MKLNAASKGGAALYLLLATALLLPAAANAELAPVISRQQALPCDKTPPPASAADENGQPVYGDVTANVQIVNGHVETIDFLSGPGELRAKVETALRGYECDAAVGPRTATMTFNFRDPKVKAVSAFPSDDPRSYIELQNSLIRRHFPARLDALMNAEAMNPQKYQLPALLEPLKVPEIPANGPTGEWKVSLVFILDADARIKSVRVEPESVPEPIKDLCRKALQTAKLRPATYDGTPVPVVLEQPFVLDIGAPYTYRGNVEFVPY